VDDVFTIEMLALDNDHGHPKVVYIVVSVQSRLADADRAARSLLETVSPSCNAFQIKDVGGKVVLRSWDEPETK
jgi:hypothetical protein